MDCFYDTVGIVKFYGMVLQLIDDPGFAEIHPKLKYVHFVVLDQFIFTAEIKVTVLLYLRYFQLQSQV